MTEPTHIPPRGGALVRDEDGRGVILARVSALAEDAAQYADRDEPSAQDVLAEAEARGLVRSVAWAAADGCWLEVRKA